MIAGGQSLVAMMNLRLASPGLLIDIARVPELCAVSDDADAVTLGACVTHAAIEDGRVPDPSRGLMPRVAATLPTGRSATVERLAVASPSRAQRPIGRRSLAALDAEVIVRGPSGRRTLKCTEFATGPYETQLAQEEIVETVRISKLSAEARWGYVKLIRPSGVVRQALAVVLVDHGQGLARIVLGAANGAPLVLDNASRVVSEGGRAISAAPVAADLDRAADRHLDDFQISFLRRSDARRATGAA